jgi:hypothetical protein
VFGHTLYCASIAAVGITAQHLLQLYRSTGSLNSLNSKQGSIKVEAGIQIKKHILHHLNQFHLQKKNQ